MKSFLVIVLLSLHYQCMETAWNGSQKSLVPAYFYPSGTYWDTMINAGAGIIVVNPNSGPGTTQDLNYKTYINKARSRGIKVIGYVYTSYGARATSLIQADINTYRSFYTLDGFFLDEIATETTANLAFYTSVTNYIRSLNSTYTVVLNPGVIPVIRQFMDIANVVVIQEDAVSAQSSLVIPSWLTLYSPSKICLIYYNAKDYTTALTSVAKGKTQNAGYMFVTNDVLTNPYDTIPPYYARLVKALRAVASG